MNTKVRRRSVTEAAKKISTRLRERRYVKSVHATLFDIAFDLNDFVHELPGLADEVQTTIIGKTRGEAGGAVEVLLEIHQAVATMEVRIRRGLGKAANLE